MSTWNVRALYLLWKFDAREAALAAKEAQRNKIAPSEKKRLKVILNCIAQLAKKGEEEVYLESLTVGMVEILRRKGFRVDRFSYGTTISWPIEETLKKYHEAELS